ncbi:DsbA family oxidoreductase [Sphingomonas immobilis]|uniref:DsbA family oxidoreductase n=1 Tax=Sphingomonas immobilis TaxID=3063997 RepID=A0ABT8ZWZ9_9SPHN|nr:DsbA family oxidoreductase [Sphingomonas sp. CA1-15]MDO7842112.1 DsbA family oxidoreductase [Sphingomonas sp. CA1-15]
MAVPLKIDFVSDVVCPWCVIGLRGLEIALEEVGDLVAADIAFHPFELNPDMPPEGENTAEHIARKYGANPEQSARNRDALRERATAVGFTMNRGGDGRIYNSFDAHRLLHWAGLEGRQAALKHALFTAYFTDGRNIADHDVLVAAAEAAGLDAEAARGVLTRGDYAEDVRGEERTWRQEGITAVPTIVINDRYVISGGHEPAAFERALRSIASDLAPA